MARKVHLGRLYLPNVSDISSDEETEEERRNAATLRWVLALPPVPQPLDLTTQGDKKSREEEVRSPGGNLARTSVWKPWEEGSVKIKVKQEFAEHLGHGTDICEPNGGRASEVVVEAKQESEKRGTNMFETNDGETSVEELCTVFVEVDVKKELPESSEDTLGQLLTQYLDAHGRGEDKKQSSRNRLSTNFDDEEEGQGLMMNRQLFANHEQGGADRLPSVKPVEEEKCPTSRSSTESLDSLSPRLQIDLGGEAECLVLHENALVTDDLVEDKSEQIPKSLSTTSTVTSNNRSVNPTPSKIKLKLDGQANVKRSTPNIDKQPKRGFSKKPSSDQGSHALKLKSANLSSSSASEKENDNDQPGRKDSKKKSLGMKERRHSTKENRHTGKAVDLDIKTGSRKGKYSLKSAQPKPFKVAEMISRHGEVKKSAVCPHCKRRYLEQRLAGHIRSVHFDSSL